MQTNRNRIWQRLTLLTVAALLLAACGGNEEPTATPTTAAATATSAPAATTAATDTPEAVDAPESPLAQPQSPLAAPQPESPLTTAPPTAPAVSYPQSVEEAIALADETVPPEPLEGHGSLGGVIYSFGKDRAVYGTGYYLTPAEEVDGEFVPPEIYFGPKPENGDVVGQTNERGQLLLDNVPPGHYYLMLWTVYSYLSTFSEPEESANPVLIEVEDGDQTNLGVIYANWP